MTQLSKAGRERRRLRYATMLLEARMLGASMFLVSSYARATPNSHNLRELTEIITNIRRMK